MRKLCLLALLVLCSAIALTSHRAPSTIAAAYVCPATADSSTPTVINGTSYCFNTYSTPGTYTWTHPNPGTALTVNVLVVGGGGAGGSGYGAGGGGGGAVYAREDSWLSYTNNKTVRVGAGGVVGVSTTSNGGDGESSSVDAGTCTTQVEGCAPGGKGGKGSPLAAGASGPTSTYATGGNLGNGGKTFPANGRNQSGSLTYPCCTELSGGWAQFKTDGTYGWYSGGSGAGSGKMVNEIVCCNGGDARSQSGGQGYPPNARWGASGSPTSGYTSSMSGSSLMYGGGGGGGNDMVVSENCASWYPTYSGGCGANTRSSTWNQTYPLPLGAEAGKNGRGGGGGGGGKNVQTSQPMFGAAGGSGIVIIRWAAPYLNDPTITWNPTTSLLATDSPVTLPAASTSGNGALSYSVVSTTASSCLINSGTRVLTFSGSGNCVVRASAAQTSTYASASLDKTFIISRASQTVTWNPSLSLERTDSPVTLPAASTSGDGALSYSVVSTTATSCLVDSGTRVLTFSGSGNCVVRASAAQTSTYASASLDKTFLISDTTAPVLTLAAFSSTSSNQNVSFTLTGNEPIDCSTVTQNDFILTGIDQIDAIVQTTSTRCTITATSSVSPGSSGTSSLRASQSFSVDDVYGNSRLTISAGSPAAVTVTIADVTAPVLTLSAVSANVVGTAVSFTLSANEAIDCSTVTQSDFVLTGLSSIDAVVQSTSSRCTITATAAVNAGAQAVVTLRASGSFSVEDVSGNATTVITTGAVVSVQVSVPNTTTTSTTNPVVGQVTGGASTTTTSTTSTSTPATTSTSTTTSTTVPQNKAPLPVSLSVMQKLRTSKQTAVVINGEIVNASTEIIDGKVTVTVSGVTSALTSSVTSQDSIRISADGVLLVKQGEPVLASAQGLAPESKADVWVYSTPVQLGDAITDASGAFVSQLRLPNDIGAGEHRLVVSGKMITGSDISIVFAMEVLGESALEKIASSPVTWFLLALMVLIALVLPNQLRRRR